MSKAEEYADRVIAVNYCDEDDPDISVDMDERMDPPVRFRDMKAWLEQGYEAGYAAGREDGFNAGVDAVE